MTMSNDVEEKSAMENCCAATAANRSVTPPADSVAMKAAFWCLTIATGPFAVCDIVSIDP